MLTAVSVVGGLSFYLAGNLGSAPGFPEPRLMKSTETRVRGWQIILLAIVLIAAICRVIVSGLR